jgi:REP element-mobilizing transposase RayT
MSQSLVKIPIHLVFSTHTRQPLLTDCTQRTEVHRYLAGICNNIGCTPVKINGVADHVHLCFLLGRQVAVADLVRDLKNCSSKWIRIRFPGLSRFQWQKGYGAFAVDYDAMPAIIRYIENQQSHHLELSFQDEFRKLCREAGVEIDERFAWD